MPSYVKSVWDGDWTEWFVYRETEMGKTLKLLTGEEKEFQNPGETNVVSVSTHDSHSFLYSLKFWVKCYMTHKTGGCCPSVTPDSQLCKWYRKPALTNLRQAALGSKRQLIPRAALNPMDDHSKSPVCWRTSLNL